MNFEHLLLPESVVLGHNTLKLLPRLFQPELRVAQIFLEGDQLFSATGVAVRLVALQILDLVPENEINQW